MGELPRKQFMVIGEDLVAMVEGRREVKGRGGFVFRKSVVTEEALLGKCVWDGAMVRWKHLSLLITPHRPCTQVILHWRFATHGNV